MILGGEYFGCEGHGGAGGSCGGCVDDDDCGVGFNCDGICGGCVVWFAGEDESGDVAVCVSGCNRNGIGGGVGGASSCSCCCVGGDRDWCSKEDVCSRKKRDGRCPLLCIVHPKCEIN